MRMTLVCAWVLSLAATARAADGTGPGDPGAARKAETMPAWKKVWSDPLTKDWEKHWALDGLKATLTPTPEGLVLKTGPVSGKNASHAVLWTRESYKGDIRVAYDFTRLDKNLDHVSVCIFYLQATGTGGGPYAADILAWRNLRETPAMNLYFNHMNCYHVSYACTGGPDQDYVRARRYPAKGNFDKDTRLEPSYEKVGLFKTGETWRLTFEKVGTRLTFSAERGAEKKTWAWDASTHPAVTEGRLGLRQMFGRESRYANFEVFVRE